MGYAEYFQAIGRLQVECLETADQFEAEAVVGEYGNFKLGFHLIQRKTKEQVEACGIIIEEMVTMGDTWAADRFIEFIAVLRRRQDALDRLATMSVSLGAANTIRWNVDRATGPWATLVGALQEREAARVIGAFIQSFGIPEEAICGRVEPGTEGGPRRGPDEAGGDPGDPGSLGAPQEARRDGGGSLVEDAGPR